MVQMLLEKIKQHSDMGCTVDILQLVTAQLGHHDRILLKFVEDIKQRYADIARQDGARQ